jgi:hypothetical protein
MLLSEASRWCHVKLSDHRSGSAGAPGFCYVVTKQYLQQPPTGLPSQGGDPGEEVPFNPIASATDTGLLKVTVRVSWRGNLTSCNTNPYQTSGVVAG